MIIAIEQYITDNVLKIQNVSQIHQNHVQAVIDVVHVYRILC